MLLLSAEPPSLIDKTCLLKRTQQKRQKGNPRAAKSHLRGCILCPIKEYTTPTIDISLDGAHEALANAARVIVTLKGRQTIEKEPAIDRSILSVSLTQEETAILGVGPVLIEATILTQDGCVLKSDTIRTTIDAAVRKEVTSR